MIKITTPCCSCPVCTPVKNESQKLLLERSGKKLFQNRYGWTDQVFIYPNDLPHNLSPLEYKFFSMKVEDRARINYEAIDGIKDEEEITTLIYNIYFEKGIEALEEFLDKSGIKKLILDHIIKQAEKLKKN